MEDIRAIVAAEAADDNDGAEAEAAAADVPGEEERGPVYSAMLRK